MLRATGDQERQVRTRAMIALGGIVAKAGLGDMPPALLLGLLLDGRRRLEADDGEKDRLTRIGSEAIGHDGQKAHAAHRTRIADAGSGDRADGV